MNVRCSLVVLLLSAALLPSGCNSKGSSGTSAKLDPKDAKFSSAKEQRRAAKAWNLMLDQMKERIPKMEQEYKDSSGGRGSLKLSIDKAEMSYISFSAEAMPDLDPSKVYDVGKLTISVNENDGTTARLVHYNLSFLWRDSQWKYFEGQELPEGADLASMKGVPKPEERPFLGELLGIAAAAEAAKK